MAKNEYIDRGALQEIVYTRLKALEELYGAYDAYGSGYEECADRISEIPAADVAPVVHARWKDNHCTACGMMPMGEELWDSCEFAPPKFEYFMDFCPSCGARMDGGKHETD